MVANLLWAVGTNGYLASAANLLTTELNALANASLTAAGTAIDNSAVNAAIYCDVEFIAGGTWATGTNPYMELWFLRSLDGGSNYEEGSNTVTPGRRANVIIQFRPSVTIAQRIIVPMVLLPPGHFKPLIKQTTNATLPATGNILRLRTYAPAI